MSAVRRADPSRRQPIFRRLRQQPNRSHPRPWGGGRKRDFAKHCFAPLEPAGCAKPAVDRGVGL